MLVALPGSREGMGVGVRILQMCKSYLPAQGGIETRVVSISERLARKHDVTVFTADAYQRRQQNRSKHGNLAYTKAFIPVIARPIINL